MSPENLPAVSQLLDQWYSDQRNAIGVPSPCVFKEGKGPTPEESIIMARLFAKIRNMDKPIAIVVNAIIADVMSKTSKSPTFSEVHGLVTSAMSIIGLDHGPRTFTDEWGESIIDEILRISAINTELEDFDQ